MFRPAICASTRSGLPDADASMNSMRRYYVDKFFRANAPSLTGLVLDIGGRRWSRRGAFSPLSYSFKTVCLDLTPSCDVQAEGEHLPFRDEVFAAVLCSEVVEHVADPFRLLKEAHRVLIPRGRLLLCAPFLYPIHNDPSDYLRFTDQFWALHLPLLGFDVERIESHGAFLSGCADIFRSCVMRWNRIPRRLVSSTLVLWLQSLALRKESFMPEYTTGFGVVAVKQ